jgi:hypothetical protein
LQTFVEHWNGASWSAVASPNGPGGDGYLAAVSAVSASNIWAVGATSTSALIERWNRTKWWVQSSPAITGTSFLSSVREISAIDVWAVGNQCSGALAMRYNGTVWTLVPELAGNLTLNEATASTAEHAVWAVGSQEKSSKPFKTFAEHVRPA